MSRKLSVVNSQAARLGTVARATFEQVLIWSGCVLGIESRADANANAGDVELIMRMIAALESEENRGQQVFQSGEGPC